jgi:hypothetical protein
LKWYLSALSKQKRPASRTAARRLSEWLQGAAAKLLKKLAGRTKTQIWDPLMKRLVFFLSYQWRFRRTLFSLH